MKNLFDVIHEDFFKPLTGKYRRMYADVILLIYEKFRGEITYGVNREIVVKFLMDYFDVDDDEISFDDENYIRDPREKANGVIQALKSAGWIEYEQAADHEINVVLFDYAIPVIESMRRVMMEEETEYQGIISQIHAILQNEELYTKPYELIIMGVRENTDRLLSELKRLSVSIKRHLDRQTSGLDETGIMEQFLLYHTEIGSRAYLRMKTADNVSRFRSAIIDRITFIMEDEKVMQRAVAGFMEVEGTIGEGDAYDELIEILMDIKSAFYRLDDIIAEIDRRHTSYLKNAVLRARFLLSTGNNLAGKIERVLRAMSESGEDEGAKFSVFSQRFISPESLRSIPVKRDVSQIDEISRVDPVSKDERALHIEALRQKNRNAFSKKNINDYLSVLLAEREMIPVDELPTETRRDLIRIIYISIYAGSRSNIYRVKRYDKRVTVGDYEFPYFEIIRR